MWNGQTSITSHQGFQRGDCRHQGLSPRERYAGEDADAVVEGYPGRYVRKPSKGPRPLSRKFSKPVLDFDPQFFCPGYEALVWFTWYSW